jgi:hypothetical protein
MVELPSIVKDPVIQPHKFLLHAFLPMDEVGASCDLCILLVDPVGVCTSRTTGMWQMNMIPVTPTLLCQRVYWLPHSATPQLTP